MFGIRKKLLLGQIITIVIICVLGYMTTVQINKLGSSVDVTLRENYTSVRVCNDIIIAVDNINRNFLFVFSGIKTINIRDISNNFEKIRKALQIELETLTLDGEKEKAERMAEFFKEYESVTEEMMNAPTEKGQIKIYLSKLIPVSDKIRAEAFAILEMNQANMDNASERARALSISVFKRTAAVAGVAVFLIIISGFLVTRWVLRPIKTLLESTDEIRKGNLNLVVDFTTKDELGKLSESFNDMTAALREIRDSERATLVKTRRTTEEIFDALPAAIVVTDLDGTVVFATKKATNDFNIKKGLCLKNETYDKLYRLSLNAIENNIEVSLDEKDGYMEKSDDKGKRFFTASAIPIPQHSKSGEVFASAVTISEITDVLEQKKSKRDALSAFSKQLYEPLSSLKTALYVVLADKVGELNNKQTELLVSARDDGDKLSAILEDILEFNGIQSADNLDIRPVSPKVLAEQSVDKIMAEAKEKGVAVTCDVSGDLPEVVADKDKIAQAFLNILSNALAFTDPGGEIRFTAEESGSSVKFIIADTGCGIDPKDMPHIFDMFYQTQGGQGRKGPGLGLAAVKEIIAAHGGEIRCESELNKGTVFEISLGSISANTEMPI